MNLVIDIGNTRVKGGFFRSRELIRTLASETLPEFIRKAREEKPLRIFWISTRKNGEEEIRTGFPGTDLRTFETGTSLPYRSEYRTFDSLGRDRVAAVSGAMGLFPGKDLLVIDAGTCITTDLLISGVHKGGSISPGVTMRYQAMHNFTGRLPLPARQEKLPELPGLSTDGSLHGGAVAGTLFELDGMISHYRQKHPGIITLLTGGDGPFLAAGLKNPIFADPFLVLKGLNDILLLNAPES